MPTHWTIANNYLHAKWMETEGAMIRYQQSTATAAVPIAASAPGVPEPGSWALLIGGLGLIGAAMRRRAMVAA